MSASTGAPWLALLLVAGLAPPGAAAAEAEPPAVAAAPTYQDALTGGWGGARARLAALGATVEAGLTAEAVAVPAGGVAAGARLLGDAEAKLRVDLDRLAGWPGATATLYGVASAGGNPSDLAGDLQGVSNIAAPRGVRLLEAWLQQNLLRGRLSLLVGLSDLNSEFYLLQAAALFLNSSFGIGPEFSQSGLGGPSIFPATSLGGRVEVRPWRREVLRLAIVNGVPLGFERPDGSRALLESADGALLVAEVAHVVEASGGAGAAPGRRGPRAGRARIEAPHALKVALGAWHYTARFPVYDAGAAPAAPTQLGNQGAWIIGEADVYRSALRPERRVQVFAQLAAADPGPSRVAAYTGLGATRHPAQRGGRDRPRRGRALTRPSWFPRRRPGPPWGRCVAADRR